MILRRLDVAVVNVEAMSERNSSTRLDVGLDVVGPDGALVLVGGQNHDHVGLGGSLGHGLDLEALLLGEIAKKTLRIRDFMIIVCIIRFSRISKNKKYGKVSGRIDREQDDAAGDGAGTAA